MNDRKSRPYDDLENGGPKIERRAILAGLGVAALAAPGNPRASAEEKKVRRGRVRQSVVKWCYDPMPIDKLAAAAAAMGILSVELVEPKDWPVLKRHGLTCALATSHGFVKGLNNLDNHPECVEKLTRAIEASAEFGCPNVITFSGMRGELTDEEGIRNMVTGLKKVAGLAETKKVTVCLEPLNTRVAVEMKGHPGYQCDKLDMAVKVIDQVGSDRVKILFDVYHTQIMEGDIISRIRQLKDYIAHYHTAGVPGRNEISADQEINYPAVMKAIVATGYTGFVGQEFIPTTPDPLASLADAVDRCDV